MPPLPLLPNQPIGASDIVPGNNDASRIYAGTRSGAVTDPGRAASSSGNVTPEQWDKYIATIQKAMEKSSGFELQKLQSQENDAKKARQNALAIAQLQAETSRYGYDQTRETTLATLKENARQYDANHELDMQKFGLTKDQFGLDKEKFGQSQYEFGVNSGQAQQNINLGFAKTATDYLSTPDRFFQAGDYIDMGQRALQGLGPRPYGATGTPVPKTTDEFAVLSGYMQPGEQPMYAGGTPGYSEAPGAATGQGASGRGTDAGGGMATNDPTPDPRMKAVKGIFDAIPPSNEDGLNSNDWAALQAAKALYSSNLKPYELQRMRPGQLAMNRSAGARLGYNVPDWEADVQNYGVGQGSSRAA